MTPLHWQEDAPISSGSSQGAFNPWFAASIGLLGLIAGFGIGKWNAGTFPSPAGNTPPAQIAQMPTPTPTPQQPPEPTSADNLPAIDPQKDHIRGDITKAKVAVIEYSDFECPFCKRHHPTMQQVMDTYEDDVVWVYRHFPLSFHANAEKEAEATECANELGGNDIFWKYTDAIFERTTGGGTGFPLADLVSLAQELGLDESKFQSCLDSGKYAEHVKDDMAGGSSAGVNGTPGNIVVNLQTDENRIISGAVPFASFKAAIDGMLGNKAQASAPTKSRIMTMKVDNWAFSPNVIQAKLNENITIELKGINGIHGISIPDLGINETIMPGQTVSIVLPTDKAGTFDFACSVACGSGHGAMTGKIVIE